MEKYTKVVVSAIIWKSNKILLLKRAQNFKELKIGKDIWDLPGGKLEFGLEMHEALQNELTEETTNVKLNSSLKLLDAISYTIDDGVTITNRINIIYSLKISDNIEIGLSEEHNDFIFTNDKEEIRNLDIMLPIKRLLLKIVK